MDSANHLPLFKTLNTLSIQFLNCNNYSDTAFCGIESLLFNPSFVHPSETAFSKNGISLEVLCGTLQLREAKSAKIWGLQYLPLQAHFLAAHIKTTTDTWKLSGGRKAAISLPSWSHWYKDNRTIIFYITS